MTDLPSVTIYSDGGCDPNPGTGGWAALLIRRGGTRQEISGAERDTTNNRMELTAAVEALRLLDKPHEVRFYTDSQYVKKGISEWLPKWVAHGWKRGRNEEVKNQDLWMALHAETQRHRIRWEWVRGHAGNQYNERVDQLATAARSRLVGRTSPPPAPLQEAAPPAPVDLEAALRICPGKKGQGGGWAIRAADSQSGAVAAHHTGHDAEANGPRLLLLAALDVLRQTPREKSLRVWCPDEYLSSGMTQWIAGWQKKNWQTSTGKPVKHQDIWRALLAESAGRQIEWTLELNSHPAFADDLYEQARGVANR